MLRSSIVAVALATSTLLGGCGGGSSDEPCCAPPPALTTAAEACAALGSWWSETFARCNGITAAVTSAFVHADASIQCADWTAAVADGTTVYDRAKALSCLDQIGTVTCNQIAWANAAGVELFPYDCSLAMVGSLGPAATCSHDFECASGICTLPAACDAPGTCTAAPGLDATCAGAEPYCADGLVCDAGTCVARTLPPAPVELEGDCTAAPCVDAAYCRSADRLCVGRQTAGTSCAPAAPCVYGHHCSDTNTCRPTVAPGGPCTFGRYDCALGAACVNLANMLPGDRCAAWGSVGTKCGTTVDLVTFDTEVVGCVDSWCDIPTGVQGTCAAWTAVGAVCAAGTGECGPANGFRCADDGGGTLRCERLFCDPGP